MMRVGFLARQYSSHVILWVCAFIVCSYGAGEVKMVGVERGGRIFPSMKLYQDDIPVKEILLKDNV